MTPSMQSGTATAAELNWAVHGDEPHNHNQDADLAGTTFLDCTLRDGGYYNNWQFDKSLAMQLVGALVQSGIDIIEVGFKTPLSAASSEFDGLYRYCSESQLQYLKQYNNCQFAFMINTKEFLTDDIADAALIDSCIKPQNESVFHWARIATHLQTFSQSLDQAVLLKQRGYRVALNLMGISLLDDEQIIQALRSIPADTIDVFYFADSFGNLKSPDVVHYVNLIRAHYEGQVGIHTHDNQGLAFANVLTALECNVDFIDSTVTGMGRGAGNLRTEQLLLGLQREVKRFKPAELLDVIDRWLGPLQQQYGWGWDYTYMLSAIENIHPIYCQNLRSNDHYSKEQVSTILGSIDKDHRVSYDKSCLLKAIDHTVNSRVQPSCRSSAIISPYVAQAADECLVIAAGPSRQSHTDELISFIKQRQPQVIECNPVDDRYESVAKNYTQSILNWVKLQKVLDSQTLTAPLVTGLQELPYPYEATNIFQVPCRVSDGDPELSQSSFALPAYVVGMFAVGIARLSNPRVIYLAGYDGYPDSEGPEQQEMEDFFHFIQNTSSIPLISLINTNYSLPIHSIYGYLK